MFIDVLTLFHYRLCCVESSDCYYIVCSRKTNVCSS